MTVRELSGGASAADTAQTAAHAEPSAVYNPVRLHVSHLQRCDVAGVVPHQLPQRDALRQEQVGVGSQVAAQQPERFGAAVGADDSAGGTGCRHRRQTRRPASNLQNVLPYTDIMLNKVGRL
jgi:hypothetical protein